MENLEGNELVQIMYDDVYFALPVSVVKWLNKFGINSSQRLIIERMIGFALQRPTRHSNNLNIRLSLSLIVEYTGVCERTVVSSLQKLSSLGLITKNDYNQSGTLYSVNLSEDIKGLVKKRFKKPTEVINTPIPEKPKEILSNPLNNQELTELVSQLNQVNADIDKINITMPEGFSPIQLLRNKVTFDDAVFEKLNCLNTLKAKLETDIQSLQSKQSKNKQINNDKSVNIDKNSLKQKRYLNKKDTKGLMTRIKALDLFKSKTAQDNMLKEILWAVRFGWYTTFKGSTFHCFNHALKLIKNNDWRTPAGFKGADIEGLIAFHGLK